MVMSCLERVWWPCLAVVTLYVFYGSSTEGAKILVIPADHISTINFFAVASKALMEAGHDVTILSVERHKKLIDGHQVPHLLLEGTGRTIMEDFSALEELTLKQKPGIFTIKALLDNVTKSFIKQCEDVFENDEMMNQLLRKKFDLVIVDGFDAYRCAYLYPYKLGTRYITMTARHDPWGSNVPAMPSIEPAWPFFQDEDDPSFLHRLKNLFVYVAMALLIKPNVDSSMIDKYVPERPKTTFNDLFLESDMWLVNLETNCFDYHRISAPHYQFLSGMASHDAKPLPSEIEAYVQQAEHGLIVVTFGSVLKRVPVKIMEKMMHAFGKLKQRILMRFDGTIPNTPDNVRLEKWLPQNDLLGHNKTILFVTHAGNNGQLEALYHGVPMLCMPFAGDQAYNAFRTERKGYGLHVDPFEFESSELYDKMQEIISNVSYKQAIQHCSDVTRNMPTAREKLIFYVDHILRFGGEHLKSRHIKMPLWKVFMLDVLTFLLALTYMVYRVTRWLLCVLRHCCRGKQTTKSKKD